MCYYLLFKGCLILWWVEGLVISCHDGKFSSATWYILTVGEELFWKKDKRWLVWHAWQRVILCLVKVKEYDNGKFTRKKKHKSLTCLFLDVHEMYLQVYSICFTDSWQLDSYHISSRDSPVAVLLYVVFSKRWPHTIHIVYNWR